MAPQIKSEHLKEEKGEHRSLIAQVGGQENLELSTAGESAWIEVIHKMDSVYADLIESQVELEKKNVELEDAQQFISSVLSSMTDVLIVCDTYGKIQQVNAALEHLTGYKERSLIGRHLEYIFAIDQKEFARKMSDQLLAKQHIDDYEMSIVDVKDQTVPLSMNCSLRFDYKGKVVGMVLMCRPIGELRRAYEKLDQAHHTLREAQQQLIFSEKMAALGRLVAGVAHELNNPISFVFGNMHALKTYGVKITQYLKAIDDGLDQAQLDRLRQDLNIDRILDDILPLVDGTLEGAERVSDIVQELRQFSSRRKNSAERFKLRPMVETAVNWVLSGTASTPNVSLECAPDLEMFSRKGYVHQIIINLMQNALDALCKEGTSQISIDCKCDNEQVFISISDNGTGIAEKDLSHIFEPFYTTKDIGQGTGLGLYVSYNMAEELGGDLVGGNNLDEGAVFRLSLPRTAPKGEYDQ